MQTATTAHCDRQYQTHLKHLKLKGLQPKTIDAYARAIRRMGAYFAQQIDDLSGRGRDRPRLIPVDPGNGRSLCSLMSHSASA